MTKMTSLRHQQRIKFIAKDGHKLTSRERLAVGLPERPMRRSRVDLPSFPDRPDAYRWFALVTPPQREMTAAFELFSRLGVMPLVPQERVEVRRNRRAKFRREEKMRPILTSMVLVGFSISAPVPWLTVLDLPSVRGFVGIGGAPICLPVSDVIMMAGMDGRLDRTRNYSPAIGDEVEVLEGAFVGHCGKVIELAEGQATVRLLGLSGILAELVEPVKLPEVWLAPEGGA